MTANLPLLILAILLLWFPRGWMRRGVTLWRKRHRHVSDSWVTAPQDGSSLTARREFKKPRNYYDFLRGAAGAIALLGTAETAPALFVTGSASRTAELTVLAIKYGALLVAVLIQTVRYERNRISLAAPVFFLGGISLGLCSPWGGACAFLLAWALSPIVPNAQGFLSVQAFAAGAFGILLIGLRLQPIVGLVLNFLPVLLSLLARKPLVVFSRRSSSSGGAA